MSSWLLADVDSERSSAIYDAVEGRRWGYSDLEREADRFARALDTGSKSLVACLCRNTFSTVAAYIGVIEAGHTALLLNASLDAPVLQRLLGNYRPEFVVAPDTPVLSEAIESLAFNPLRRAKAPDGLWVRDGEPAGDIHPDLAALLPTSGSTGSPKLVRLTRQNLLSNATSIRQALAISSSERAITSLPLFYSYGLSVINSHLIAGASFLLTDQSVLEREFWARFSEYECTSFAGVPYTYEMLLRIGFERFDLPSLRTMTQAGGRLVNPLIEKFYRLLTGRAAQFVVMYGQTEATARIACLPPDMLMEKLGSVGIAIPGGRIEIHGDGKSVSAPGEAGEVVYSGANVMMGYATKRSDLARGDELNGVLHTGDLGYLDADGYLFLVGRSKRISKIFGLRINLDELETMLRAKGQVAVVGTDDDIHVCCEVGRREEFRPHVKRLAEQLRLPPNVFKLREVDAIPVKPTGKVDYEALKTAAAASGGESGRVS